jgi:hypothetical protein
MSFSRTVGYSRAGSLVYIVTPFRQVVCYSCGTILPPSALFTRHGRAKDILCRQCAPFELRTPAVVPPLPACPSEPADPEPYAFLRSPDPEAVRHGLSDIEHDLAMFLADNPDALATDPLAIEYNQVLKAQGWSTPTACRWKHERITVLGARLEYTSGEPSATEERPCS